MGVLLTATLGGLKRPRYVFGLCASLFVVQIGYVSTYGARHGAPRFDLSVEPEAAAPYVKAASVEQMALRARSTSPPSTTALVRAASTAKTASAGSALAEASSKIETVPSTTATTVAAARAAPTAKPKTQAGTGGSSSGGALLNLPLSLGPTLRTLTGANESGEASWFHAPDGTCAHQTLPFGTLVKVTNVISGTTTTCKVDDRGPFIDGRVIDLSYDTFEQIAHPGSGVIDVVIEW